PTASSLGTLGDGTHRSERDPDHPVLERALGRIEPGRTPPEADEGPFHEAFGQRLAPKHRQPHAEDAGCEPPVELTGGRRIPAREPGHEWYRVGVRTALRLLGVGKHDGLHRRFTSPVAWSRYEAAPLFGRPNT